jgi:hypothetical protein
MDNRLLLVLPATTAIQGEGLSTETQNSNDEDDVSFSGDDSSVMSAKNNRSAQNSNAASSSSSSLSFQQRQRRMMQTNIITSRDDDVSESLKEETIVKDDSSFSKFLSAQNDNDENGSFSSSSSSCDEDDSEYETKWSLHVKLNSAVDLPTCILPSVPLCPLLKFGLVTITEKEQLQEIEQLSAAARRAEFEKSQDEKTKDLPQSSLRVKNGILGEFQKDISLVQCCLKLQQEEEKSLSTTTTTRSKATIVISSSDKIMSKKDNGMMEWHEEIRWDDIQSPLQTVLAVELCARAVFPRSLLAQQQERSSLDVASSGGGGSSSGISVDADDGDGTRVAANGHVNDNHVVEGGEEKATTSRNEKDAKISTTMVHGETGGHGILGLWRRGRQTIAERRNRRMGANNPASPVGSSNHGDLDANESDTKNVHQSATNTVSLATTTTASNDDLRLGTLLIPISNLPLEDEIPRVEKWYQFETLGSGSDKEQFKKSPWRSPTVLLDIALCTSSTMDNLEEEMYAIPRSNKTLGNEEEKKETVLIKKNIPDSKSTESNGHMLMSEGQSIGTAQITRKTRSNSKQQPIKKFSKSNDSITAQNEEKKDDDEKVKQHGPCLEPGIIDYICVVGPKDMGQPVDDTIARGWINSEPDCCVLEQFPSNDYHRKNGR